MPEFDAGDFRQRPVREEEFWRARFSVGLYLPHPPLWPWLGGGYALHPDRPLVRLPFRQLFVPADDPWPRLPGRPPVVSRDRTPSQQAASDRSAEHDRRDRAVALGLMQRIVTDLDLIVGCDIGICRRARRCGGLRAGKERTDYPGPDWPACVHNPSRAQVLLPMVEAALGVLDEAIQARLRAAVGNPWSSLDRVGLTAFPGMDYGLILTRLRNRHST